MSKSQSKLPLSKAEVTKVFKALGLASQRQRDKLVSLEKKTRKGLTEELSYEIVVSNTTESLSSED